jgi:hypothetical protein
MIRRAHGTRLVGARIAIIERQIGVVGNIDEIAIAVAYVHEAVVIRLRGDGRVLRGEIHAANAHRARSRAAFVVHSGTIGSRITADALTHIVAYERIGRSLRRTIRSLRQVRIRRYASRTHVVGARIAVIR